MRRRASCTTLFPYTTLFRSLKLVRVAEPATAQRKTFDEELSASASAPAVPAAGAVQIVGDGSRAGDQNSGRFDLVAADRKSTRLNSSHTVITYAVYCLNKKT